MNNVVQDTFVLAGIQRLTIGGRAGLNDVLRLNFGSANARLLQALSSLTIDLGGDPGDDLIINADGGDVVVVHDGMGSGSITVNALTLPFAGVGSNTLYVENADDLTMTFGSTASGIVFTDHSTAGYSQVAGTNFTTTQFANPTGSFTVNLGSNSNTLTFTSLDAAFNPASININGGSGDNVISFTGLGSFTGALNVLADSGNDAVTFTTSRTHTSLNVQAENIALQGTSMSTSGGNMALGGNVTLSNGPFSFSTGGGNLEITGNLAAGGRNITLASGIGAGTTTIGGNVSGLGTGTGTALTIQSGVTGLVRFLGSVAGASGLTAPAGSSLRFDGNVTLGAGNTGSTLAGNVWLDGLTWTSHQGLSLGNVTLSGAAVSLNSNNSPITLTGTVNGAQDLTLTAGTGNIDFDAAVGSGTRLGALSIVSAASVTFDEQLHAASVTQQAGTGTTTFVGAVSTNAAPGLAITTTGLLLNSGLTTTNGGNLTASLSGNAVIAASTSNTISGAVALTASGSVTLGAAAQMAATGAVLLKTTGNSVTLLGDARISSAAGNVTLEAEDSLLLSSGSVITATLGELILRSGLDSTDNSGGMTLNGTLQALAAGQCITLDLNDEQGATQNASTGAILATNLRLRSNSSTSAAFSLLAGNDVDVLAAETSGAITFSDVDSLTVGSIVGSAGITDMSGLSTVNSVTAGAPISIVVGGAFAANQAIRTSPIGGGNSSDGTVTLQSLTSTLSLTDDADITSDGPVSLTAATGISTAAEITTSGDNITFVSPVTLSAAVDLSTGAAAGNILFSQSVNGPGALTLTAGTGTVSVTGHAGHSTPLGTVTVVSSAGTSFGGDLNAASFTQTACTGAVSFAGTVQTSAATGVNVNASAITLNFPLTTASSGPVILNATAAIQIAPAAAVSADGNIAITAPGGLSLGGNLNSTNDPININAAVTLTADVSISAGSTGANVAVTGSIDAFSAAQQGLTLNGGSAGAVTVTGAIGRNTALKSLTLSNSNGATFGTSESDTIQAQNSTTIANSSAGSNVLFSGALITNNLTTGGAAWNLMLAGNGSTIGATSMQHSGQAIFGDSPADTLIFLGPLTVTAPSSIELFGRIQTRATVVTLGDANTPVNLRSADAVIDTTNNGDTAFAGGATITFGGVIEAQSSSGNQNLTLNAGSAGDIIFSGSLGASRRIGRLQIAGVRNTVLPSVTAQTLLQTTGTGTTTFNGTVNTTSATGVDITTTNIIVNALITTIVDGSVPASAPGIVRLQATAGTASDTTGIITILDPGRIVSSNDVTIAGNRNVQPAILVYEATPAGPDLTPQTRDFITTTTLGADVLIESSINFISPGETANNN
ncbi:MAG: beta strand repeat-containing protein, partial [Planctomyces sp.]